MTPAASVGTGSFDSFAYDPAEPVSDQGVPAGTYQLSFAAAQRGNGNAAEQDFAVLVDGIMVATFMPAGTGYETDMTTFAVAAGAYTIDRSVGGSHCARRSDRPKHRRASLRASVSSDRRAQRSVRRPGGSCCSTTRSKCDGRPLVIPKVW